MGPFLESREAAVAASGRFSPVSFDKKVELQAVPDFLDEDIGRHNVKQFPLSCALRIAEQLRGSLCRVLSNNLLSERAVRVLGGVSYA